MKGSGLTLIWTNDNNSSLFWINPIKVVGMTMTAVVGFVVDEDFVKVYHLGQHVILYNVESRTNLAFAISQ